MRLGSRGIVFTLLAAAGTVAGTVLPSSSTYAAAPPRGGSSSSWSTYQDPFEKAFTIQIPRGWIATGGLFRVGLVDVVGMIDLRSPDGKILIRSNDVRIPAYYVPPGFPYGQSGTVVGNPKVIRTIVEPFVSGTDFAGAYARVRFQSVSSNLDLHPASWNPSPIPLPADDQRLLQQSSAGSVAATVNTRVGPRVVEVYAQTCAFANGPVRNWHVQTLLSIMAPPDGMSRAQLAAQHMISSVRLNPAWVKKQAALVQMVTEASWAHAQQSIREMQATTDDMTGSIRRRMDAEEQQENSFDNILNGTQDVSDPLTGEKFQVNSGPAANYWRDGLGDVVNSTNQPNPYFHPLHTR